MVQSRCQTSLPNRTLNQQETQRGRSIVHSIPGCLEQRHNLVMSPSHCSSHASNLGDTPFCNASSENVTIHQSLPYNSTRATYVNNINSSVVLNQATPPTASPSSGATDSPLISSLEPNPVPPQSPRGFSDSSINQTQFTPPPIPLPASTLNNYLCGNRTRGCFPPSSAQYVESIYNQFNTDINSVASSATLPPSQTTDNACTRYVSTYPASGSCSQLLLSSNENDSRVTTTCSNKTSSCQISIQDSSNYPSLLPSVDQNASSILSKCFSEITTSAIAAKHSTESCDSVRVPCSNKNRQGIHADCAAPIVPREVFQTSQNTPLKSEKTILFVCQHCGSIVPCLRLEAISLINSPYAATGHTNIENNTFNDGEYTKHESGFKAERCLISQRCSSSLCRCPCRNCATCPFRCGSRQSRGRSANRSSKSNRDLSSKSEPQKVASAEENTSFSLKNTFNNSPFRMWAKIRTAVINFCLLEAEPNPSKYNYDSRIIPEVPLKKGAQRLLEITELPFMILWVYFIYWAVIVSMTASTAPSTVWLSATVAGLLVGIGLNANAYKSVMVPHRRGSIRHHRHARALLELKRYGENIDTVEMAVDWGMVIRFFIIPFGVSSLSGLTNSNRQDFLLVFPIDPFYLTVAILYPAIVVTLLAFIRITLLWKLRIRWSLQVLFLNGALVD